MSVAIGVFGISGVGKSTLLQRHIAAHPTDRHVGGSSVIKAVIAPASVRDLDKWPADRQQAARDEAIRRLRSHRDATSGFLLVDGHFSLRNRATGQVTPVLTDDDRSFYDALVLIDASAHAVHAQTRADTRQRHGQSLDQIEEHLAYERAIAGPTAMDMGVPLLVITSTTVDARLSELAEFLSPIRACVR